MTQAAFAASIWGHSGQHFPGAGGSARAPHVNTGHVCREHTAVPFMHVQSVQGSTRNLLRWPWYSLPMIQGFGSVVPETENKDKRWIPKPRTQTLLERNSSDVKIYVISSSNRLATQVLWAHMGGAHLAITYHQVTHIGGARLLSYLIKRTNASRSRPPFNQSCAM